MDLLIAEGARARASQLTRLVRQAHRPVLWKRGDAPSYHRPAVAVKLDSHAPHLAAFARDLAQHASLTVIHAHDRYPAQATSELRRLLDGITGVRCVRQLEPGDPRIAIPRAVASARADLLVIGYTRRPLVERLLFGELVRDVLDDVACDALLVPLPDSEDDSWTTATSPMHSSKP